ncbi:DUF4860 domain-containing protein [Tindallia californiensis]|uniref:Prepilin-type N-terminal cleavage/methylation domain-containing protein n=1 Tax=Tindallia californiensis TaxID=159292 RepID=A0A1H3PRN3_9FIRM|nr:DUF4860 domain-containing protein [Tindallia californiensis]SDZ03884.1 protein of unknown function [Tindallia californiensis]
MNKIRQPQGYSLIELILVMALLVFLGLGTFTLIIASNEATHRMVDRQDQQSQRRVAASYINTRLRQNDKAGAVSLRTDPALPSEALVIEEVYFGEIFENWIYQEDGKLKEIIISPGQERRQDFSYIITEIDFFDVEKDPVLGGLWLSVGHNLETDEGYPSEDVRRLEWFYHIKTEGKTVEGDSLETAQKNRGEGND